MLTFTALGGSGVRLAGAEKPLIVFPEDGGAKRNPEAITLLAAPEEQPADAVLSWPGEYSIAGTSVRGVGQVEGRQVSFVVEADGVRCAFLSSPLQDWSDKQLEMVGDIDVLVLPTDEVKLVQKLVDEFDPRILLLIPSKDVHEVVKTISAKETVSEYKLKGALPAEGREVYVLSR